MITVEDIAKYLPPDALKSEPIVAQLLAKLSQATPVPGDAQLQILRYGLEAAMQSVVDYQKRVSHLQRMLLRRQEEVDRAEELVERMIVAFLRAEPVNEPFYELIYGELPEGVSAKEDYFSTGWRSAKDPSPWFSTRQYLDANPDVVHTGVCPLEHYLEYGWREHRRVALSDHAAAYLDSLR